jgi:hypothetical protein
MIPSVISGSPKTAPAGDAEVGGEGELAAAAERVAVDRRDDDLRRGRQGVEGALQDPVPRIELRGRELEQPLHVGPGREMRGTASHDDRTVRAAGVQRGRGGREKIPHRLVERVERRTLDAQ